MSALDALPMLRVPASWPNPLVAALAMVVLAALDLVGAIAAKEWAEQRGLAHLALGLVSFVVLWWVYASSLQYAELAVVTLGWIVILQVSLLVLDRVRYGVQLPPGSWVAIVLVLAGQAYLVLAPTAAHAT